MDRGGVTLLHFEAIPFWLPLGSAKLHFSLKNVGPCTKAHCFPTSLVTGEAVEPLLHFSRSHPASMQGRPSFPCPPLLPPLPLPLQMNCCSSSFASPFVAAAFLLRPRWHLRRREGGGILSQGRSDHQLKLRLLVFTPLSEQKGTASYVEVISQFHF